MLLLLVFYCSNESSQHLIPNIGFAIPFSWIGEPLLGILANGGKQQHMFQFACVFLFMVCLLGTNCMLQPAFGEPLSLKRLVTMYTILFAYTIIFTFSLEQKLIHTWK